MRSKSRFTTLVLLETPGELSSDPCAIALYASRPLSPGATQHSLPSGRYPLLGPVFHRLDRTSLPSALIRSPRQRGRAAPKRWGCQTILCCRGARRGHEDGSARAARANRRHCWLFSEAVARERCDVSMENPFEIGDRLM